jgi:hypothetical protein
MKGADMTVGAIPWSRLPITKNSRLHKKHNELCYYKSNSVNLVCIILSRNDYNCPTFVWGALAVDHLRTFVTLRILVVTWDRASE